MNNQLLSRLEGLNARFEEVSTLITDPAVITDMKRFVKLNKEYSDLEKILAKRDEYRRVLNNIEEAKTILNTENDPDLREMAKIELELLIAFETMMYWPAVNCVVAVRRSKVILLYSAGSPTGSSSLVKSKTFSCGFQPKVVLIVPNTDTTFSTTNTNIFSAYISLGSFELRREGLYKLSSGNRVGVSSGGLSVTTTGFSYSHNTIGFIVGCAYDVYAWGEG